VHFDDLILLTALQHFDVPVNELHFNSDFMSATHRMLFWYVSLAESEIIPATAKVHHN